MRGRSAGSGAHQRLWACVGAARSLLHMFVTTSILFAVIDAAEATASALGGVAVLLALACCVAVVVDGCASAAASEAARVRSVAADGMLTALFVTCSTVFVADASAGAASLLALVSSLALGALEVAAACAKPAAVVDVRGEEGEEEEEEEGQGGEGETVTFL